MELTAFLPCLSVAGFARDRLALRDAQLLFERWLMSRAFGSGASLSIRPTKSFLSFSLDAEHYCAGLRGRSET
jgi:hypothetical protein